MQFDSKYINATYTTNKIFTNVVKLSKKTVISELTKTVSSSTDAFGSAKKTTHYNLPPKFSPEIEGLSRGLVKKITAHLGEEYTPHVLTKKVEFWQPKNAVAFHMEFNAIKFTIVVNHQTKKIWVTPILTVVEDPDEEDLGEDLEEDLGEKTFR